MHVYSIPLRDSYLAQLVLQDKLYLSLNIRKRANEIQAMNDLKCCLSQYYKPII